MEKNSELRNNSIKKAFIVALFSGISFPILFFRLCHETCPLLKELLIMAFCILLIFFLLYFILLSIYKCPECKENWVYTLKEDDIIDRNIQRGRLPFAIGFIMVGLETHIEERNCSHCNYKKIAKKNKIYLEFGK